ncbi:MAG: Spy/CpxP family protein refolding chaperone [Pseudomonadota bacterium]
MKRSTKWILSGVLATSTALGAGAIYAHQKFDGAFNGHARGHYMIGKLCGGQHQSRIDDVLGVVESFVDMDETQRASWDALVAEVRASSGTVDAACAEVTEAGMPASIPDKLALAETVLGASLDIMQRVRPEFTAFYATLSPEQRESLERLASHRRHHRGWH